MQVSSQTQPTPMPIVVSPREERFNENIYEASNGYIINTEDGELALTPQGQTNLDNKKENNALEAQLQSQEQKDQQRANGAEYLAHKSMQSQVEIYLAVATDSNVDIQKQNSAVEAYAIYEENQKGFCND